MKKDRRSNYDHKIRNQFPANVEGSQEFNEACKATSDLEKGQPQTNEPSRNTIRTVSGAMVDFLHLDKKMIKIEDIAWGLATEFRYGGHTGHPLITVAQHSVEVAVRIGKDSRINPRSVLEYQLAGLMHDASEAYLRDIPKPIKELLPDYQKLEKHTMDVICQAFSIILNIMDSDEVKGADQLEFLEEQRFFRGEYYGHHKYEQPWTIEESFQRFIEAFNQIQMNNPL